MHKTQLSGRRYSCKSKISLVLVLLFLMGWATGVVSPPVQALSTTRAELNEAKERQSALSAERTRLAGISRQLDQERDELTGQLAWLNKRSDEQKALYREKTAQLEAAVSEMEQAYADYIAAEEDLASKQVQYSQRIQTMINYRPKSILEIFLGSRSLQGFFTTLQFMSIIADADQQMIEDLQASKDHAAMMRDIAKQHATDMEEVVKQLEAELAKLEADAAATKQDLEEIELKLSRQQQAEADLLAEAAMVAELVKTLQKKVASEQATAAAKATAAARATAAAQKKAVSGKGWAWPYPADHTIYSAYGMRFHPIYRYYRMHTGVDLGGKYGNSIVASRAGEVLLVRNPYEGRNTGGYGYGNYIVIDHGDGYCSLYAHLKNTLVRVGQQVSIGQKIATCGSTGTSTGPHLHFEILYNGKTVDPAKYIR
ncbi:MAG: peptidoglycan DD-metalloendopeptidase family protein [Clostridiaceae bacterium]|nr:peptidoglycan DD-metalloendopeptidase family protein [Clostridiaceae bacterium]